jgi:hypothetical protein
MSTKILDFLLYGAATIVVLSIISSATVAEREYKEEVEAVELIETDEPLIIEEEEVDLTSEVIFTSQDNCTPCKAFERDCVAPLRNAGWRVTRCSPDGRPTPSFDIKLGGRVVESKTGYRNRGSFFRWLKKTVEVKR